MTEPEDDDFRAAVAELRDRRRERALELRGEGLTARQIAARLGVSHPTVLSDLNGEEPELTGDQWLRSRVNRGSQDGSEPFDGDSFIRSRTARKPRAQALVDKLLAEYDEGDAAE